MRLRIALLATILLLLLASCSTQSDGEPEAVHPTRTNAPATTTPTPSKTNTSTPLPTPTQTRTPKPTDTPLPTPTQWGGGKGFVMLNAFNYAKKDDLKQAPQIILGLSDFQIRLENVPAFRKEPFFITEKNARQTFSLVYPQTGEIRKVLDCPPEYQLCSQQLLYGSPWDEWVYVSQGYARELYDGKRKYDLYKIETGTGRVEKIDTFAKYVFDFKPFPGGLRGLLSLTGFLAESELLIYDLETQERLPLTTGHGQYLLFGFSPNRSTFFYRITDSCITQLLADDGTKLTTINNSDGAIGWLDDERFLVKVAGSNNPPNCTNTGIAIADRHGLTREFVTRNRSNFAELAPDGKSLVFTSDCRNQGCQKLMLSPADGGDARILYESSEYGLRLNQNSKIFSPDSKIIVFFDRKNLVMINVENDQTKTMELYDQEYDIYEVTFADN